jgi:hypothetical protein
VTLEDLRQSLPDIGAVRAYASDSTKWIVDEIPNEPLVRQKRFSKEHVTARVAQVERILENLSCLREELGAASGVGAAPGGYLAPPRGRFADATRRTLALLASLSQRLAALRSGFLGLSTDATHDEVTA